jgi:hypothetical protein
MPSLPETSPADARARKPSARWFADLFEIWNRKLHFYIGLYLLLFLWLFAFTGLLLNHAKWKFAEFWPNRTQWNEERAVQIAGGSDLEKARGLMRQLGLRGDVEWTVTRQQQGRFDFRVQRPGHVVEVKTDVEKQVASVQHIDLNAWGVMHVLHTFTGVRVADSRMQRDWILTRVWSGFMDAVAIGLVFMVLSSIYMWYGLKKKRRLGIVVLILGVVSCGFFVAGLGWLFA